MKVVHFRIQKSEESMYFYVIRMNKCIRVSIKGYNHIRQENRQDAIALFIHIFGTMFLHSKKYDFLEIRL